MTSVDPISGVNAPPAPIPNCPDCGWLLGLYYAECATCAHHSGDYSLSDYNAALGGDA